MRGYFFSGKSGFFFIRSSAGFLQSLFPFVYFICSSHGISFVLSGHSYAANFLDKRKKQYRSTFFCSPRRRRPFSWRSVSSRRCLRPNGGKIIPPAQGETATHRSPESGLRAICSRETSWLPPTQTYLDGPELTAKYLASIDSWTRRRELVSFCCTYFSLFYLGSEK